MKAIKSSASMLIALRRVEDFSGSEKIGLIWCRSVLEETIVRFAYFVAESGMFCGSVSEIQEPVRGGGRGRISRWEGYRDGERSRTKV